MGGAPPNLTLDLVSAAPPQAKIGIIHLHHHHAHPPSSPRNIRSVLPLPGVKPRNTAKTASNGSDAPRAEGAAAGLPPKSPLPSAGLGSPTSPTSRFPRPVMQSMSSLPDTRQQSFDEIYGPPENFLEIEVRT